MITKSTFAPTNHQHIAEYQHKAALRGIYARSAHPYPSRSLPGVLPLSGAWRAAPNDEYRPEMADCRGW